MQYNISKAIIYTEVPYNAITQSLSQALLSDIPFRLVIAARTADKLAETEEQCHQFTPHVHSVRADVAVEEDCKAIVDKAVEKFGGVDILI